MRITLTGRRLALAAVLVLAGALAPLAWATVAGKGGGATRSAAAAASSASADVVVVPYGSDYRYSVYPVNASPADWASASFDDSFFPVGSAPFGSGDICPLQSTVRTFWPSQSELLLRRTFSLPAGASGVKITLGVDNDAKVAVNGVQLTDWLIHEGCPTLEDWTINVPGSVVLEGNNLLAILGREQGVEAFLDLQITRSSPTAATVSDFTARPRAQGARLRWTTASENNLLGFNVWRYRGAKGVKVNRTLIRAKRSGEPKGASYRYVDPVAGAKRGLTYRLQLVDLKGKRTWYAAFAIASK